jgi:hypothetical protein
VIIQELNHIAALSCEPACTVTDYQKALFDAGVGGLLGCEAQMGQLMSKDRTPGQADTRMSGWCKDIGGTDETIVFGYAHQFISPPITCSDSDMCLAPCQVLKH